MKIVFEVVTNKRMEDIADKFIIDIQSMSKKHKVDLDLKKELDEYDLLDLERVMVKPSFESKELTTRNYQSFHKEYLDKYVNDNNIDLMVMDIK
jgi:hypothetical protein